MPNLIEPLVYDRTATDIANLTAKAFINVVDWARINENTEVIHALVEALTGLNITFTSLTAPTITTFPTAAQINAFIANIENVRVNCGLPASIGLVELKDDWVAGQAGQSPDYEDANDWERTIWLIITKIAGAVDYRVYCGVSTVGQARLWQNRFRRYAWVQDAASPVRRPRTNVATCGVGMTRQNKWRKY